MKQQSRVALRAINQVIGERIKIQRCKRGINQTQLAPVLGLDQSALSRVESGRQQLTAAQWVLLNLSIGVKHDRLSQMVRRSLVRRKRMSFVQIVKLEAQS